MAFDLHLIICTWDVVTTCIPVTVFFPLGVWFNLEKEKKKKEKKGRTVFPGPNPNPNPIPLVH